MLRDAAMKTAVMVSLAAMLIWTPSSRAAVNNGRVQGVVKSASGQPLAGAYVKLKDEERRLTFMVVSHADGRYTASGLPAGKYTVQGIGEGMQSDLKPVEVGSGKAAVADVSLTNPQPAELAFGWPGRPGNPGGVEEWVHEPQTPLVDDTGKEIVMTKCHQCHESERIVLLRFDRGKWESTVARMRQYIADQGANEVTDEEAQTVVNYLTKHYSGGPGTANQRPDVNSRLPRTLVKPDAANYVAVDYELPTPDRDPHDLTVDPRGVAWIPERNGFKLAKFDPKTFEFSEITPPAGPQGPTRLSDAVGRDGDLIWLEDTSHNRRWLSFNTKTEKFTAYPVPESITGPVGTNTLIADKKGRIWGAGSMHVLGLDPATGKFVAPDIPYWAKTHKSAVGYGMAIDGAGKVWFAERDPSLIGKLDPDTLQVQEFQPPIPGSIPRRMGSDSAGNIWVALHQVGKMVRIDYETNKMTLLDAPAGPHSAPYIATGDKNGIVWFSEQGADRVARFDIRNEQKITEYAVPNAESDMRRIELDLSNPNRLWWGGDTSNHIGYIELTK